MAAYPSSRKKKKRSVVPSGPRVGRPGSGIRRPTRAPATPKRPAAPRAAAPQFTPARVPTAADIGYGSTPQLSGGTGGYDIGADPAVQAAAGIAAKIRATAQAQALAKRKQAAIEYGDATGVEGVDEATAKAAADNPFSVLKNIEHTYETGRRDLEEELNKANLFYSGYRGQQLGEAARAHGQQRYDAANAFRGLMTDINDRLADALLQADSYEASAIGSSDGGSYGEEGPYDDVAYSLAQRGRQELAARGALGPAYRPTTATKPWKKSGGYANLAM